MLLFEDLFLPMGYIFVIVDALDALISSLTEDRRYFLIHQGAVQFKA